MDTTETLPALDAPLGTWAAWYAAQGWPVFPCHGKAPITRRGFYDASCDPGHIASWWAQWPEANIGAPLGHWAWALDEDPRHGGDLTRAALEAQHGELPTTMQSLSGRGDGGGHRFFLLPEGGITHKASVGEGLDVIGLGGYAILPPSVHPETNQPYQWEYGPDEILPQPPPAWLLTLVTAPRASERHEGQEALPEGQAIPAGQRNATLARLAGSLRHAGCTPEEILVALMAMNGRCVPPLPEADLATIARSIGRYPPAATLVVPRNGTPALAPTETGAGGAPDTPTWEVPWRPLLLINREGHPSPNASNYGLLLARHPFWQTPDHWLWWDSVRQQGMLGDMPIDPDTITGIAEWLGTEEKVSVGQLGLLERAVMRLCRSRPRDLIQEWLAALPPWDGVERLCDWLPDCAGAPNTVYGREVSRLLPVAMVARALHPGCQFRSVVILEGPENIGKSKLVKLLAGDWYRSLSTGLDSKEAHMLLQGAWLVELEEMTTLRRTEESRLKGFITLEHDAYIPKFSNFVLTVPRRAIFIGTHNPEGDGTFLNGQTGNTRFLPLPVTAIEADDLCALRPQLFAEALLYYAAHPDDWWQLSAEAEADACLERDVRRQASVYEGALAAWLASEGLLETTWEEIAQQFLFAPKDRWTRGLQMEIARALKGLGWRCVITTRGNRQRARVWRPPLLSPPP